MSSLFPSLLHPNLKNMLGIRSIFIVNDGSVIACDAVVSIGALWFEFSVPTIGLMAIGTDTFSIRGTQTTIEFSSFRWKGRPSTALPATFCYWLKRNHTTQSCKWHAKGILSFGVWTALLMNFHDFWWLFVCLKFSMLKISRYLKYWFSLFLISIVSGKN